MELLEEILERVPAAIKAKEAQEAKAYQEGTYEYYHRLNPTVDYEVYLTALENGTLESLLLFDKEHSRGQNTVIYVFYDKDGNYITSGNLEECSKYFGVNYYVLVGRMRTGYCGFRDYTIKRFEI